MNSITKRTRKIISITLLTWGIISAATGCNTAQRHSAQEEEEIKGEALKIKSKTSSIEIEYVLGRSHYRLAFNSIKDAVEAQNWVDKQTISKSAIQYSPYLEYLHKTIFFVKQNQAGAESQNLEIKADNCRAPFRVTVHVAEKTYAAKGCRNRDRGALSKLIQQGEFLLYSNI